MSKEDTLNHKTNYEISLDEVRLIDESGNQLGIIELTTAQKMAEDKGFDLVEVSPGVCKFMDLGLIKFNESKKPKPKKEKLKQAQFNVGIGDHDFDIKIKNIEGWLREGSRVNIKVQLRGRLAQRPELAQELSLKILDSVTGGQLTSPPKMSGDRDMVFSFSPA